jgi:hypothetical protein
MFAEEIHIGWLDLVYIDAIDRHNTPNFQQRTFYLPKFAKTP